MTALQRFRDGSAGPTTILFIICVIITFALAGVYQMTEPTIEQRGIDAINEAMAQVLEGADTFTQVNAVFPDGKEEGEKVLSVYKADNGAGYTVRAATKGFGGLVTFMIGMDANGGVTGIKVLDHSETPGLGTKITNIDYLDKYSGQVDPNKVDNITGASYSSRALKKAVALAQQAYKVAKGAN